MDVEFKWILLQVGYCRQVAIYPVIYQSVHSSSRTGGDGGIVILANYNFHCITVRDDLV